jgi:hypothetical protein
MGKTRQRAVLESYKHKAAKEVLAGWLKDDFDVIPEVELSIDGWAFIVDLVTYRNGHIQAFYEVTHTHPVDARKLCRMQHYCWMNYLDIFCHEVDAEWILRQVTKPDMLVKFTFELNEIQAD